MTEPAEDTDIEASSIAATNHRFRVELIGDADTRSKFAEVLLNIHCCVIRAITRNANCAGCEVGEATLPSAVNCLGEIHLPTKAQV